MSIVLYVHPISPPARAALATAKTLKLNVTEKSVELGKDNRTAEYLKMNPAHTVPVLVDGDFTLFESRAIMGYLVDTYAKNSGLYPTDVKDRAKVDCVLYYDASSLFPMVREYFVSCSFVVSFSIIIIVFISRFPNTCKAKSQLPRPWPTWRNVLKCWRKC